MYVILCELEYRMSYYQVGCKISGLTFPKVLIAIPCEKNQRETLGRKIPSLTGPADRSDRSGQTASLFEPTGLGDRSDRSNTNRATASF